MVQTGGREGGKLVDSAEIFIVLSHGPPLFVSDFRAADCFSSTVRSLSGSPLPAAASGESLTTACVC